MTTAIPDFVAGSTLLVETPTARTHARIDGVDGTSLRVSSLGGRFTDATPAGTSASLLYVTTGGVYSLVSTVVDIDEHSATLRIDTAADRLQRRRYVRLERPLPAHVLLLDDETGQFHTVDARVTDVSGGGLAMRAGAIAPQGTVVVVALSIPDERPVVAVGAALANDREDRERLGPDGTKLRIQFTHLTEADRDRLIRHILRATTPSDHAS